MAAKSSGKTGRTNPHIPIFDEAASAQDYGSEAIKQHNVVNICKGRAVSIIALGKPKHEMRALKVSLGLSIALSCIAADLKVEKNARPSSICHMFAEALKQEHAGATQLYVDSVEGGGRDSIYQGIDLDNDGKADEIRRSCGSPSDGSCTLYVQLSTGKKYEMSEEFFKVRRFRSKYYVVVGDNFPKQNTHRRLYSLSEQGAELICKSF